MKVKHFLIGHLREILMVATVIATVATFLWGANHDFYALETA